MSGDGSKLTRFFDLSLDVFLIVDSTGRSVHVNSAVESILGWSAEEFLRFSLLELVHSDDVKTTLATLESITTAKRITEFEVRDRCKDGGYKWIRWRVHPADEQGRFYAVGRESAKNVESGSKTLSN